MAKSKINLSADQISKNWVGGMKAAVPKMTAGVNAVVDSPMAAAAAAVDSWADGVAQSKDRFVAGLNKVNVQDWKRLTVEKITQRMGQGVDSALPKRQEFDRYLVNQLNSILPTVAGMPNRNIEEGLNKVRAVVEHMHNNPYKR